MIIAVPLYTKAYGCLYQGCGTLDGRCNSIYWEVRNLSLTPERTGVQPDYIQELVGNSLGALAPIGCDKRGRSPHPRDHHVITPNNYPLLSVARPRAAYGVLEVFPPLLLGKSLCFPYLKGD